MERATYLHRANTNPTLHNFTRGNLRSSLSEPRKREGEKIETVTLFFRIIWSKLQMETALHDAAASLQPRSQISETTGRACVCEHESSSASPPFALTEDKCQRAEREREREKREEREDAAAESCAHPVRNANAKAKRELASSKRANNAVDAADGSTTCG